MEYAIFYDERSKGAALKQLDGITDPASIIRTFSCKTYLDAMSQSHEIHQEIISFKKIPVILIDALEEPVFTSICNSLHEFQRIVSGTIDVVNCCDFSDYDIICNGEGKIKQLPLNRSLTNDNEIYDVIAGTMIITKSNKNGETLGLSMKDADCVHKFFYLPEIFTFSESSEKISVVKPSFSLAKIMKQNFISNFSIKQ